MGATERLVPFCELYTAFCVKAGAKVEVPNGTVAVHGSLSSDKEGSPLRDSGAHLTRRFAYLSRTREREGAYSERRSALPAPWLWLWPPAAAARGPRPELVRVPHGPRPFDALRLGCSVVSTNATQRWQDARRPGWRDWGFLWDVLANYSEGHSTQ